MIDLPLHVAPGPLTPRQLLDLPPHSLTRGWHGEPLPCFLEFLVALSPDALLFGGGAGEAPRCDRSLSAGQFLENLWEQDLLELFIGDPGSDRYFEINLAPTGAWWSCLFDRYRERSAPPLAPPAGASACSLISAGSWKAALSLPLASLPPWVSAGLQGHGNVCGIRGAPRQFATFAPPQAASPDFHDAMRRRRGG